jgi:S-adenosylmethionine decarboxylase
MNKALKKEYEETRAWGLSSMIDLHECDPQLIRDADAIKKFVVDLCNLIKMKRFRDCVVVDFGEDEEVAGFSMTQLIETSLISGHFSNKTNRVFLDVFSCKYYDPEVVADFAKKVFKAKNYNLNYKMRK